MSDLRQAMKKTWRATYRPFDGWRKRADAVGREADPLVAPDIYQALRNDIAYLEDAIGEAADELDAWIQLQTDIA
ncbi:MAG: hypothetical protein IRY94_08740 [Rhodospirillaceae bacterium]|nr:hypothetical protein [Rhodospirillaceae bacterium]